MAALKKVEGLPDQNAAMKAAAAASSSPTIIPSPVQPHSTGRPRKVFVLRWNRPSLAGFAVTRDNWTSTMLPPNNLSYDRESPEPKTAFLFGLALGAVVPLLVLAVSA